MAKKEEIRVRPTGFQDEPAERVFELNDFDHILPKIYTLITLTFELGPETDRAKIISDLQKSLEITLSQYPFLAGTLQTDPDTGRLSVLTRNTNTVTLTINYDLEAPNSTFPSFEELERLDFPASILDGELLLPHDVVVKQPLTPLGEDREDDTIISTFQLNFIRGGLILGAAVHHSCTDGPGTDGFFTQWAENSRALATGAALPPFDPASVDSSRLILRDAAPDLAKVRELGAQLPALKYLEAPPTLPAAGFKMPEVEQVMFHFPAALLPGLKAVAKPTAQEWVTTYEAIMALLWRCITRSRLALHGIDGNDEGVLQQRKSALVHAVGLRKALPDLPPRYMGNFLALPKPTFPLSRILSPDLGATLPVLAAAIRGSILESTAPARVRDTQAWIAATPRKDQITLDIDSFMGLDLAATTWGGMVAYQEQDFGFGLPSALRRPKPNVEGYVFVYPKRPRKRVNGDVDNEGIEACVVLEKGCMDRLRGDAELAGFAEVRGYLG